MVVRAPARLTPTFPMMRVRPDCASLCPMRTLGLLLLLATWPAAGAGWEGRLRLQAGEEFDSNATRVNQPTVADGVHRLLLDASAGFASGAHWLGLSLQAGGKLFYTQSSENQAAWRLQGRWSWAATPHLALEVGLRWHETVLEVHDRDYRLLEGRAGIAWRLSATARLQAWAGGRWFYFKPDDYFDYELQFSNAGPLAGLQLRLDTGEGVSSYLFYTFGLGLYPSVARRLRDQLVVAGDSRRLDLVHAAGMRVRQRISLARSVHLLLELGYVLAVTDTNSYGSAALRHRLQLLLGLQLPAGIGLQLLGRLQFTDFRDGVYLEGDLYEPEADENENSLVIRLRVPLLAGVSAWAQGALFRNDFQSSQVEVNGFRRWTALAGLAYQLEL